MQTYFLKFSKQTATIIFVVSALLFLSLTQAGSVFAQAPTSPPSGCNPGSGFIPLGDCLKLSDDSKINETYTTPAFLVNLLVRNIFAIGAVILFFMILLAGFQFIAGGKKGMENAKQIISAALLGFLLMFSAYWIVQIVKLLTGANILL